MVVLLLSADSALAEEVIRAFRARWPDLHSLVATQARVSLQRVLDQSPDAIVLINSLPDMDLWSVLKAIQECTTAPIVVLATEPPSSQVDHIKAVLLGADDYIPPPYTPQLVSARLARLVQRSQPTGIGSSANAFRCGQMLIVPATHEVNLGALRITLTPTEFKLLYLLASNNGTVLSNDFILSKVWEEEAFDPSILRRYIYWLRLKLGDNPRNPTWIRTVTGKGYVMDCQETEAGG